MKFNFRGGKPEMKEGAITRVFRTRIPPLPNLMNSLEISLKLRLPQGATRSKRSSRSRRLEEAENLRVQARKKGEERDELREQAQKARELGESSLAETLMKLAKKCWNAMKRLNRAAANIFYKVRRGGLDLAQLNIFICLVLNWNAKPGEVDLHRLHRHEAIERAKKKIQEAILKGQQTIRFITGKGKHSEDGPKILPALQKYIKE
ncbi:hypothetical protein EI94DRAFT_1713743 [Lactarius quietus]|nr:hypothetical protein EI94DRAFT_1713743 [Lactarius quietus]